MDGSHDLRPVRAAAAKHVPSGPTFLNLHECATGHSEGLPAVHRTGQSVPYIGDAGKLLRPDGLRHCLSLAAPSAEQSAQFELLARAGQCVLHRRAHVLLADLVDQHGAAEGRQRLRL